MKRTAIAFTLALLFSALIGAMFVNLAAADPFDVFLPNIVIESDGTVTPETEFIEQSGSVYTLTGDISQKYSVVIQCSNIVFDGAGHAIIGSVSSFEDFHGGFSLHNVTNVTVKDLEVTGFMVDIGLHGCTKCVVIRVKANKLVVDNFDLDNYNLAKAGIPGLWQSGSNTIAESSIGSLGIHNSDNNLIAKNNITGVLGLSYANKNSVTQNNITSLSVIIGNWNKLFENNFSCENNYFENWGRANSWDNGSIGNYWSNYLAKYPNATEIGNTGIGDIPYVIDSNNIDNYPLVSPAVIPDFPDEETSTVPPTEPPQSQQPSFLGTGLPVKIGYATLGVIVMATVATVVFLVYFRKIKKTTGKVEAVKEQMTNKI